MSDKCESCNHILTDKQLDQIVELAVKKLQDQFYRNIGKTIFDRILIGIGIVGYSAYTFFKD